MILQPTTVELTKIHYYDPNKNAAVIPTISREVFENNLNKNIVIKKNIFGHKWVLKINEVTDKKKSKCRLLIYVLVFTCIVIAVAFGIFFTIENKLAWASRPPGEKGGTNENNTDEALPVPKNITHERINLVSFENNNQTRFCENCQPRDSVCLKLTENDTPKCLKALDIKDPTGCGGICSINTQYCQLLDSTNHVYQCSNLKNTLKCPQDTFNCGNRCINQSKRCDGIVHCSNKSDEITCDCDLSANFRCGDTTSCLPKTKKCDGVVDCWDRSDEIGCAATGCAKTMIPCVSGGCIPKENFCDGVRHCADASDEPKGCQLK